MPSYHRRLLTTVAALAALALCPWPPALAGESVTATMNESFEINGRLFDASVLKVSELGEYSPVATFNEIWVDRECLGLFIARERPGAPIAASDELIFRRTGAGHLVLEALAVRGQPVREILSYREVAQRGEWYSPALEVRDTGTIQARGGR